jgi:hypothetical protein
MMGQTPRRDDALEGLSLDRDVEVVEVDARM